MLGWCDSWSKVSYRPFRPWLYCIYIDNIQIYLTAGLCGLTASFIRPRREPGSRNIYDYWSNFRQQDVGSCAFLAKIYFQGWAWLRKKSVHFCIYLQSGGHERKDSKLFLRYIQRWAWLKIKRRGLWLILYIYSMTSTLKI